MPSSYSCTPDRHSNSYPMSSMHPDLTPTHAIHCTTTSPPTRLKTTPTIQQTKHTPASEVTILHLERRQKIQQGEKFRGNNGACVCETLNFFSPSLFFVSPFLSSVVAV